MHLGLTSIVVDDYDDAIRFFVDSLRFELVEDSPSLTNVGRPKRSVVVLPPGAETGILLAQADGEEQRKRTGDQMGGRVSFFLNVDDFDGQYDHMRATGLQFLGEPETSPTAVSWCSETSPATSGT